MRLTRWEPFREMDDLLRSFAPAYARLPGTGRLPERDLDFMPLADVIEREKEYLVKVDLPDVRKEDVKVTFGDGLLTIRGERRIEKETKGETLHRTERYHGTFERSFALPEDVDAKGIHAEAKEGVLTVTLPRIDVPKVTPRAIAVQ